DYISYKHLYEELVREFTREGKKQFGLYEVEHVFWFLGGNPYGGDRPLEDPEVQMAPTKSHGVALRSEESFALLPESFVPPIVAILPRIARHEKALREVTKASGTSIERAFEKSIHASFTILG